MAQSLTVGEVHVLSTDFESILYGIFFVMYFACAWVLVKRRNPSRGINKTMLLTVTAMMVIATLFEAVSIQRNIEAFFRHRDGSPAAYYISSNWANLYQSSLWTMQVLTGGSLLVYRMYIVYGRRLWLVSLPIALLIASAVCGANVTYQLSLMDNHDDPKSLKKNLTRCRWAISVVAVNMSQSAISTLAIASRLWWVGRNADRQRTGRYWAILLESGVPYTLMLTVLTILHFRDKRVSGLAYYGVIPLTGISFTGLIIHIILRQHTELSYKNDPSCIESTYPHKIKSHQHPGTMTFAPPPTQTQGTILSTFSDSSIAQAFSGSASAPDLEKAAVRSSQSGFSLSIGPGP